MHDHAEVGASAGARRSSARSTQLSREDARHWLALIRARRNAIALELETLLQQDRALAARIKRVPVDERA